MAGRNEIGLGEILFEFSRVGNAVRVCAVDVRTNTEIVMVAPPGSSPEVMKRLARQKLAYVIAKKRGAK